MSELIAKIQNKDLPPDLKKNFSEVQHIRDNGRILIFGYLKSGKGRKQIGAKSFIKSYGHDPSTKPEPVKAIWRGPTGDTPVTVVGSYGSINGGSEYLRVRGSNTGIARGEMIWSNTAEKSSSSVEVEELKARISVLEDRLSEVIQINSELRETNARLQDEINREKETNESLRRQLAEARGEAPPVETAAVEEVETTPEGTTVVRETQERPSFRDRMRAGWDRLTAPVNGGIGRFVTRKVAVPVYDEEEGGYVYEERDQASPVAVGIAGIALGALATYLIMKHTGHDHVTEVHRNVYQSNLSDNQLHQLKSHLDIIGGKIGHLNAIEAQEHAHQGLGTGDAAHNTVLPRALPGHHIETWNGSSNSSVAIELPNGYHLSPDIADHRDIVNSSGKIVVDDLNMSKTGAISPETLDAAREGGLVKTGQEHLRYWDDSGITLNPNLHSAEDPGYNTHTVTILS